MEIRKPENNELEVKALENAAGGNGVPYYVPTPGAPMGQPGFNPNWPPVNPNMPPYNPNIPPYNPVTKKVIGHKTYCFACGRMSEIYLGPNATIIGTYVCTCGATMVDDEPIYE